MPTEPPEISFETSKDNHLTMLRDGKRAAFVYQPDQIFIIDDIGRIRLHVHASKIEASTTRGEAELALNLHQLDEIAILANALSDHLHKQLNLMK